MRAGLFAAVVVPCALVATGLASASWAATLTPVPVKDKPAVTEVAPAAHGAWFGWAQDPEGKPDRYDFYVQRGTGPRVKVNAAGTQGLGGAIVGRHVYYVQQFRDRDPRINRFDLKTGHRSALPSKVNHNRHGRHGRVLDGVRGAVTVSGDWLLYSGFTYPGQFGYRTDTVMLYNRVTNRLRPLAGASTDWHDSFAGQVNGKWVTFLWWDFGGETTSSVYRYNIKTKKYVELPKTAADTACDSDPLCDPALQRGPAVSSDGTVYYFRTQSPTSPGGLYTSELVRQLVGGPPEVITTLTGESATWPRDTHVTDRADGSRIVFYSWQGDIYKVVDAPQAATSRRR